VSVTCWFPCQIIFPYTHNDAWTNMFTLQILHFAKAIILDVTWQSIHNHLIMVLVFVLVSEWVSERVRESERDVIINGCHPLTDLMENTNPWLLEFLGTIRNWLGKVVWGGFILFYWPQGRVVRFSPWFTFALLSPLACASPTSRCFGSSLMLYAFPRANLYYNLGGSSPECWLAESQQLPNTQTSK
jgi:hypothetical protein